MGRKSVLHHALPAGRVLVKCALRPLGGLRCARRRTSLSASASALGLLLLQQRLLLMQIGGVVIVLFGMQMLGILRFGWLARTYLHVEPRRFAPRGGMAGAFVVGAAFSIGWTPCIGLFLGSLLTLAAQEQTLA